VPSKIEVWNLAFLRIGHDANIQSEAEDSEERKVISKLWPTARDTALQAHTWGWAKTSATLALTGTAIAGWQYSYRYPVDCVFARYINTGDRHKAAVPFPFEVAYDGASGRLIWTDAKDAVLVYTASIDVVSVYPPMFVEALSYLLGAQLAMTITKSAKVRQETFNAYSLVVAQARANEKSEEQTDPLKESPAISFRA